jgi:hypothetical protein
VRQRQFKMPAKNTEKREKAEDEQLEQSQSETERYLLQIDKQSKRSFKTPEQPGQLRWKSIPFSHFAGFHLRHRYRVAMPV